MNAMRWIVVAVIATGLSWSTSAQGPGGGSPGSSDPPGGSGSENPGPPETQPPEVPAGLAQLMEQVRAQRQEMLGELKGELEQLRNATQEQRRAAVEAWRTANADRIQEQRQLMSELRERIHQWAQENRPEPPENPEEPANDGELTDEEYQQLMAQIQNRIRERVGLNEEFIGKMKGAGSGQERQELANQYREQRMEQIQDRRQEWQARAVQLDRNESLAALRQQLQDLAERIRARNRLEDRAAEALRAKERATLRDLPDRPDRPERPERPEQPERPDRPDRPE